MMDELTALRRKTVETNLLAGFGLHAIAEALGEPLELILEDVRALVEQWAAQMGELPPALVNARRLERLLMVEWDSARNGNPGAIQRVLEIIESQNRLALPDPRKAFPAAASLPGQAESREAYRLFSAAGELGNVPWWGEYLAIRARLETRKSAGEVERADWRVAAYVAWASSPAMDRWPLTEEQLAQRVLGLRSSRTIRKWKQAHGWIQEEVAYWQAAPLMAHRRDVIQALIGGAVKQEDLRYFQYMRLFLEMSGDYTPKQKTEEVVDHYIHGFEEALGMVYGDQDGDEEE